MWRGLMTIPLVSVKQPNVGCGPAFGIGFGGHGKPGLPHASSTSCSRLRAVQVEHGDHAAAVFRPVALGARHQRVLAVERDREPDRSEIAGRNDRLDGVERHAVGRIERLRDVDHGDRARVAVLEVGGGLRRHRSGMVDDVREAAVGRQHDVDRLAAGRHAGRIVGRDAHAVDDRVRRAVVARLDRAGHVDHQDRVVPAPADEQERRGGRGGRATGQQQAERECAAGSKSWPWFSSRSPEQCRSRSQGSARTSIERPILRVNAAGEPAVRPERTRALRGPIGEYLLLQGARLLRGKLRTDGAQPRMLVLSERSIDRSDCLSHHAHLVRLRHVVLASIPTVGDAEHLCGDRRTACAHGEQRRLSNRWTPISLRCISGNACAVVARADATSPFSRSAAERLHNATPRLVG